MYSRLRPLLFRLDPEQAHHLTLNLIRLAGQLPPVAMLLRAIYRAPQQPVQAFGLRFANPVGLAAGYDKDGLGWRGLAALGFGHIEIGTVTPLAQPGNPQPRVFRLPPAQGVINRMGFPGQGAEFVARQLTGKRPSGLILGANLGKNKNTPNAEAAGDYLELMRTFAPLADYLAINISSPNTVGLRELQGKAALEALLAEIAAERQAQVRRLDCPVQVLVKLAPDLNDIELDDALEAMLNAGMDGVIATNTTISRDALQAYPGVNAQTASESGGLSGAPLEAMSTAMVAKIVQRTGGKLPVIGVGGITDAASARRKLDAGALLVQVYSGLVYTGPGLVQQILNGLRNSEIELPGL
jgi:dihydroorotate dehydrogenase